MDDGPVGLDTVAIVINAIDAVGGGSRVGIKGFAGAVSLGLLVLLQHRGVLDAWFFGAVERHVAVDRLDWSTVVLDGPGLVVKLAWIAGQYHPIEKCDSLGGRNRKRRRAVRRKGV